MAGDGNNRVAALFGNHFPLIYRGMTLCPERKGPSPGRGALILHHPEILELPGVQGIDILGKQATAIL